MPSFEELTNQGWISAAKDWDAQNPSDIARSCNQSRALQEEGRQRLIRIEQARETQRQSAECIHGWLRLAFFLKDNFS